MAKSIRICGISLDLENLPTKEDFIKTAMIHKQNESNVNALSNIEKELKEAGLYQTEKDNGLHSTDTDEPKKPTTRNKSTKPN